MAFACAIDESQRISCEREPRSYVEVPFASGFREARYHAGGLSDACEINYEGRLAVHALECQPVRGNTNPTVADDRAHCKLVELARLVRKKWGTSGGEAGIPSLSSPTIL